MIGNANGARGRIEYCMRTARKIVRSPAFLVTLWLPLIGTAAAGLSLGNGARFYLPENWEARHALQETIRAPLAELQASPWGILQQPSSGLSVRFETRSTEQYVYALVMNELEGNFPIYSRGSYIIKRRIKDGAFVQVKIFLHDDPNFFLRISPLDQQTLFDVMVAGGRLYHNVPLPFSFLTILTRPFSDIVDASSAIVDWDGIIPPVDPNDHDSVRHTVDRLRPLLAQLPDAEDGAMDRHGNLVYIETLGLQTDLPGFNCSGFAKWVADGIYHPLSGRYLDIDSLKRKHTELRGHRWSMRREDERDPYFGLDWSRNIGVTLLRMRNRTADFMPEAADVRSVAFFEYVEDVGYPVDDLQQILYMLAIEQPGYFYIGSINREFGEAPVLRQHIHVVILFPFFDAARRFRVAVMERNLETSLEALNQRYPGDHIHLVQVQASRSFDPPPIHILPRE